MELLFALARRGNCRHDAILRYFGDDHKTLHGCGRCNVCAQLAGSDEARDPEQVALTVRTALSGVARIHGRFGLTAAVQLLRGAADPRLDRTGLTRVTTFGISKERPEAWILSLLRRCVTAGWVDMTGQDRPMVIPTKRGPP